MSSTVNEPELGPVTDCPVCSALRETMGALSEQHSAALDAATADGADPDSDVWPEGAVHPNQFLVVFGQRKKHEEQTGHQSFGWRWLNEARAIVKTFASDPVTGAFWQDFSARHLCPPELPAP